MGSVVFRGAGLVLTGTCASGRAAYPTTLGEVTAAAGRVRVAAVALGGSGTLRGDLPCSRSLSRSILGGTDKVLKPRPHKTWRRAVPPRAFIPLLSVIEMRR